MERLEVDAAEVRAKFVARVDGAGVGDV